MIEINKDILKETAERYLESIAEEIYEIGENLMHIPELGYKEYKTSEFVYEELKSLIPSTEKGIAATGVRAVLSGGKHNANICVIGELDAVISPEHLCADVSTGAAHACGHNIQLANLLACAKVLKNSGIMNYLDGDVTFLAVPSEEFIDTDYRNNLKKCGKITYFSGKQEMIKLGIFNNTDAAVMVHSQANCPERQLFIGGGGLGFIAKSIRFIGREAHAGGAPFEGINALNAASAAMSMIAMQRETFRDEDKIRVHSIITKGGDCVNTVPADVRMELYIRGANESAIKDAESKVERALKGAAYGIGTEVEIETLGGYAPLCQNEALSEIFAENARAFVDDIKFGVDMIGSTDMGDLCRVIPAIQPTIGGFCGGAHSKDFCSCDKYFTHIIPAKIIVNTVIDLLFNNAEKMTEIKKLRKDVEI